MNKRQKAKHYKKLYELEKQKNNIAPVRIEHTCIPVQTLKAEVVVDRCDAEDTHGPIGDDGISLYVREQLAKKFMDVISNEINIEEIKDINDIYVGIFNSNNRRFSSTIKIAF